MNYNRLFIASKCLKFFLCLGITVLFCFWGVLEISAATGDDLASTVNKLLRTAERNMHNGKNDKADDLIREADVKISELINAGTDHKKLKNLKNKLLKLRKQVDKKLGRKAKKPLISTVPSVTLKKDDVKKLPGGVKKRLKEISTYLDSAERYASSDAKNAKYKLKQAERLFDEINRMYADKFDKTHPDFSTVKNRYNKLIGRADVQGTAEATAKAGAEASKLAKEKQSKEWLLKFRAYLSYSGQEGHNPEKLIFVPGTSEPKKFADAQKRYNEFKSFYNTYKKTKFPNGKTWALADIADNEAPRRLANFTSSFSARKVSVSGDAEKQIDNAMRQLEKDNGWKSNENIKPPLVDHKWMLTIGKSVEKAASALGNDPKSKNIRGKYAVLLAKDRANRKIRAQRTFLFSDIYKDADASELKRKAEAIVAKEKPGSKILRISLYQDKWTEKTVREWTDTTKTQWRVRTTRKINAQVAAKDASGVFMHTLYIAKDKQSNAWGKPYGHIMWSDAMLEQNVNKNGKKM